MAESTRLPREAVQLLLQAIEPGATILGISSLRGGTKRRVFALRFRDQAGDNRRVVLRLTPPGWRESGSPYDRNAAREIAEREFRTLTVLHAAGLAVPRPLLLDIEGTHLGRPCFVMEFAGRAELFPRDRQGWLRGFAEALAAIHSVSLRDVDLSHLNQTTLDERRAELELEHNLADPDKQRFAGDLLASEVLDALGREARRQVASPLRLVHDDYWPGNVLWRRGRVNAVIDWTQAVLGDPARDVAQFRVELSLIGGLDDARRFGEFYAAAAGGLPANVRYVELFIGLFALAHYETWYLPGYRALGLDLDGPTLEKRLRDYLRSVLDLRV